MNHCVAIGPSSFAAQDPAPLQLLQRHNIRVVPNPFARKMTAQEITGQLREADGLLAGLEPLSQEVLQTAPRLKAIARVGIGMDNVDTGAAANLGIKISNTPEPPTHAVAEMTVAAMLTMTRELTAANQAMHQGNWSKPFGRSLSELTVLIIGFGRIGQYVARLLQPFGPRILVSDPAVTSSPSVTCLPLNQATPQADIITLHANTKTCLLTADVLGQLKPGVMVLNSARASLLDEEALIVALRTGQVSKAWLDVFSEEPYKGPLTSAPNALLTPHISTYTPSCRREMEMQAVRNLLRDLGYEPDKRT